MNLTLSISAHNLDDEKTQDLFDDLRRDLKVADIEFSIPSSSSHKPGARLCEN